MKHSMHHTECIGDGVEFGSMILPSKLYAHSFGGIRPGMTSTDCTNGSQAQEPRTTKPASFKLENLTTLLHVRRY